MASTFWGTTSKNNILLIEYFENEVRRNIVDAALYVRNLYTNNVN